jgi:hypothetical protein
MSNYNPYTASASALVNKDAQRYYATRAQQDLGLIVFCVGHAAVFTYSFGAFVRAWLYATEQTAVRSEYTPVDCTVVKSKSLDLDEEFWTAVDCVVEILDFPENPTIDVAIVAEPEIRLLVPATPIQLINNDRWILNAIAPTVAALSLVNSINKTMKALAPAKTKTATKKRTAKACAERSRSANAKTATPAPRKSPTRATVGKYSACID